MLGHKRRASDTLLPVRAPKQPRTTTYHPLGGNSTPSQDYALLARWARLTVDFMHIIKDTASFFIRLAGGTQEEPIYVPSRSASAPAIDEPVPIPSPPPSPPPSRPLQHVPANTAPRKLPPRQPIPVLPAPPISQPPNHLSTSAPAAHGIHQRIQSGRDNGREQRPYLKTYANKHPNAVASTSKNTLSGPYDHKVSDLPEDPKSTGLMSPPSTQDSTSSIVSQATQTYPELGVALQQNARRRRKSVKAYIEREHILAKAHKERVKEVTKRTREQMEKDLKELYHIRRSAGFSSDYESFASLLSYQARLEKLDKTGALAPSSSLVDLRSRAKQDERKRHSFPDHVDPDFLQRAIQKAQDALKGPKPPKPFVPTLEQLRLNRLAKDEEIEERLRPKRKPLPASLPPDDEAEVDALFRKRGVIAKCGKEQVSNEDISRLRPAQWLNDEIINFYGQMIMSRAEESKENPSAGRGRRKPLNVHFFSTFFLSKLKGQGYEKARLGKWTKKIDIFSKDVILIPVNHSNQHWSAAAINFRKKRIEAYDSMSMNPGWVFKLLREYLNSEHMDKKKKPFDFTGWVDYVLPTTPQQENGYDCGVFTCQFMEALSRGEEDFSFTQANMPYVRRRMVWEIAHTKFWDES